MSSEFINQGRLIHVLKHLFPSQRVIINSRKASSIKNPHTNSYLEVDVYYPDSNLGFEFQDDYHFRPAGYSHIPLYAIQEKDNAKKELLLSKGETLVLVPCWWDGNLESLKATIHFQRPELFPTNKTNDNNIIPINAPHDFLDPSAIPYVGHLMLASFTEVNNVQKGTWWLGEKYDGVRCCWVPKEKQMYSRHGMVITILPQITKSNLLGDLFMDSEIWCGRGDFLNAQLFVQSNMNFVPWSVFRVICFDEASFQMRKTPFETRYSLLLSKIPIANPVVTIAPRILIKQFVTLKLLLLKLIESEAEGIVLRRPLSIYESGRTGSLLKVKTLSREDSEGLVIKINPDKSIVLRLPHGVTFEVKRESITLPLPQLAKLAIGDVVSFSFDFQTRKSVPTNPIIFRIRSDLSWENIVKNNSPNAGKSYEVKPARYWKKETMRKYLEEKAREMGFDPLVSSNWYNASSQFLKFKETRTLVRYFDFSFSKALLRLFPEIGLDLSKFLIAPKNYWESVKNRRGLLESFSRQQGKDPLNIQFWYDHGHQIKNYKGGPGILEYYQNYTEAIVHLFPEINFDSSKFHQSNKWVEVKQRRGFFDSFASKKGFDPLIADNWYSVTFSALKEFTGFDAVLRYYNFDLRECLLQLYPNVNLIKEKFKSSPSSWKEDKDRRAFFDKFAKKKGFDPLHASNWYPITFRAFTNEKGYDGILKYYSRNLPECLMQLYPEIGLKKELFRK